MTEISSSGVSLADASPSAAVRDERAMVRDERASVRDERAGSRDAAGLGRSAAGAVGQNGSAGAPAWYVRPAARRWSCPPAPADARAFHAGLPGYAPTRLVELPSLAAELGVGRVFVKDESARLGLPAFKALGASWALHRILAERGLAADVTAAAAGRPTPGAGVGPAAGAAAGSGGGGGAGSGIDAGVAAGAGGRSGAGADAGAGGPITFVTATDGNHGRAVARLARLLGQRAHVFVSRGVHPRAVAAIAAEGARVTRVDGPYDRAVREAAEAAAVGTETAGTETAGADGTETAGVAGAVTYGGPRGAVGRGGASSSAVTSILVQDSGRPGYERIPGWIVEGYSTLFAELDAQLAAAGAGVPDLVAVPVGVGSLAQAAVTHYRARPAAGTEHHPAATGATEHHPAVGGTEHFPTAGDTEHFPVAGDTGAALLAVEPEAAACVLESLSRGQRISVETGDTAMAGLNCGTPSSLAWPVLRAGLDAAVAIGEAEGARAVRDLAALGVSAGPCGAASLAGVRAALTGAGAAERRTALAIDHTSTLVLLSTEGAEANPHGQEEGE